MTLIYHLLQDINNRQDHLYVLSHQYQFKQ